MMAAWLSTMGASYSMTLPHLSACSWLTFLYHWLPHLNMEPLTCCGGTRMVGCAMSGLKESTEPKRPLRSAWIRAG